MGQHTVSDAEVFTKRDISGKNMHLVLLYIMTAEILKGFFAQRAAETVYPFERQKRILERIRSAGQITISDEARNLCVSLSTIHRDLEDLENQGWIRKVRGGAVPVQTPQIVTHFDIRIKQQEPEKTRIARKAVQVIKDDTSIFFDHSTTTLFLARELKKRAFRNLIVLTNSLVVPQELTDAKGIQLIVTGGEVEPEFKALAGRWAIEFIQRINLHQVFASVGAISLEHGLMTQSPFIHELLPEVFLCGREINILADSSKFFKSGTFRIAPLDSSFTIYTDEGVPKDLRLKMQRKGPELVV